MVDLLVMRAAVGADRDELYRAFLLGGLRQYLDTVSFHLTDWPKPRGLFTMLGGAEGLRTQGEASSVYCLRPLDLPGVHRALGPLREPRALF